MIEMRYETRSVPRVTFCWLNENDVVVKSADNYPENGHCEVLNTVSLTVLILKLLLGYQNELYSQSHKSFYTLGR